MDSPYGVAAIQLRPTPDRDRNLQAAAELIDEAAGLGAELVVLPEIFSAPFVAAEVDPTYFSWAEALDGPSNAVVAERSAAHGITIVSSVFEASATPGVHHNTASVFVNGEVAVHYRKSHLPFSNGFPEKYYFRPGEEPPPVVDVGPTKAGVIVCYERHFPELGRLVALGGASVMCVPVACASAPTKEVFQLELRAHAVFNSMFVVCANRVGLEGSGEAGKDYYGLSAVYQPDGDIASQAGTEDSEVVFARVDLASIAERRQRLPFLRDRRPLLYRGLVEDFST
ncbi:MAG: nitrilase-related carbon-nitrogen hydrolase [Acidimicrobiales bacterium]|jgi:N-carbamoylputrescine amidase|nr:nitrilase-related carbon-nitrogen hydrolase [Acidimicrobiales bacterium]